jgi:hypothetical protein
MVGYSEIVLKPDLLAPESEICWEIPKPPVNRRIPVGLSLVKWFSRKLTQHCLASQLWLAPRV